MRLGENNVHTTKRRIKDEVTLTFFDSSKRFLPVIEDNYMNIEGLSDLEIFELFWVTELFPMNSQKSPHTKRAYKQDLDYILRFFVTKTQGVKQLTILNLHERWQQKDVDTLILTSLLVLDFLSIHSFNDGNGRMA